MPSEALDEIPAVETRSATASSGAAARTGERVMAGIIVGRSPPTQAAWDDGRVRYASLVTVDTPAILALEGTGLAFDVVQTERPSSAQESAALQGIDVGQLLRTIVVRRGADDYLFVLVPGGRQIDWPKLRARLGVSRLSLPDADEARAATGYERGAITPFGATTAWPVVADASIASLGMVAIGGGARGVNVHLDANELLSHLRADVAGVTKPADDP